MTQQVEAIYEHGVLRPLAPLPFAESQRVSVTVSDSGAVESAADAQFLEQVRAEVAAFGLTPTLDEIHRIMAKVPGSLEEDFSDERAERG